MFVFNIFFLYFFFANFHSLLGVPSPFFIALMLCLEWFPRPICPCVTARHFSCHRCLVICITIMDFAFSVLPLLWQLFHSTKHYSVRMNHSTSLPFPVLKHLQEGSSKMPFQPKPTCLSEMAVFARSDVIYFQQDCLC